MKDRNPHGAISEGPGNVPISSLHPLVACAVIALAAAVVFLALLASGPSAGADTRDSAEKHRPGDAHHHDYGHHDHGRPSGSPIRGQAPPSATVPTVTEPSEGKVSLSRGPGVFSVSPKVVEDAGYQVREYFISGKAKAYRFRSTPGTDGRWDIEAEPGSEKGYKTRIVVFTPKDKKRFSGNVVTEWNNVTAGDEAMPDLTFNHNTVFRNGDAYVGVTAQFVGVESAKRFAPDRYESLEHPGDSYSYDIFSQAGMAVWRDYGQVLGGLRPRALIADGESQSAGRLATYIDAVAPLHNVYHGYLVHSRAGDMMSLQQAPGVARVNTPDGPATVPDGNVGRTPQNSPTYTGSRTDLKTPVMYAMSESDVYAPPNGALDYGPATQANSAGFRLWEIAGTSHVDDYVANQGPTDTGDVKGAISTFNAMLNPPNEALGSTCTRPINTGQHGYVLSAGLEQLTRWVRTGGVHGGRPASSPPLFEGQSSNEGPGTTPRRDANGNILGGVRNPAVDVPVASLTGEANAPDFACLLSGTTSPLSSARLTDLYPTHEAFVREWTRSVIRLERAGYLTRPDARNLVAAARAAEVPPK